MAQDASDKVVHGVTALAVIATLIINGDAAAITGPIAGLDLFIMTRVLRWTRIEEKMYETVTLIDWAHPIQVTHDA